MLIEQSAYANRWRRTSPAAKALFSLGGFIAAFSAASPAASLSVAAVLAAVTLAGAGVPLGRYLRVLAPGIFFLAVSCLSLAFTLGADAESGALSVYLSEHGMQQVRAVGSRSLAALVALLFLVLSTPLIDLIALLRRLRMPETLLEIMVLCYRMLFVFSEAVHDTMIAQSARLGYATPRLVLRSHAGLVACLTVQIWQRARDLHSAALSRNNDGPLRFLEPEFAHKGRDLTIAALAAGLLIALALSVR